LNNNIKTFCNRHQIKLLDTNKRASRVTKINVNNYFQDSTNYNRVNQEIFHDTETLYTLEISESELNRIADFEEQVFNHMKSHGHYGMFETMMEQKEREKFLARKYPAVQKVFEQYSLILKLAGSGEL